MKLPISAIILTFNEQQNIADCLASVQNWVQEIIVVDSGSTDQTIQIAQSFGATVVHHPFENYSRQRNWALQNLPLQNEWLLQLDADHRVSEQLESTLSEVFSQTIAAPVNGFMVSRRTIFMGKWIRFGGHYPAYHNVLFRKGTGHCEDKLYDQHFKVSGQSVKLKGDIIDIVSESLSTFTTRHNHWAGLEAESLVQKNKPEADRLVQAKAIGTPIEQRRFLKSVYERFPLFVRPALYFFIRYFLRLGFLDGRRGLIFHFLQGFWFRFLIDAKVYELKKQGACTPLD